MIDDYRVTENLWRITELKKLNEAPGKGCQKKKSRPANPARRDFFFGFDAILTPERRKIAMLLQICQINIFNHVPEGSPASTDGRVYKNYNLITTRQERSHTLFGVSGAITP